jgi:hypothetical protein
VGLVSFSSLLVHPLAIVTPEPQGNPLDVANLDDEGNVVPGTPSVELVRGMVQPRTAKEMAQAANAGSELTAWTIFLLPRALSATAYITDADDVGVLAGGRRFQIVGIRPYNYGSAPHLEVDCDLVGTTEPDVFGS